MSWVFVVARRRVFWQQPSFATINYILGGGEFGRAQNRPAEAAAAAITNTSPSAQSNHRYTGAAPSAPTQR